MAPCVALLLVVSASPPLEAAKKHLAKGQADEVAFDLEASVPDPDKAEAAKVLAQASKLALLGKDSVIALHCAQKALKLAPREPFALEAGARAAFAEQQFEAAEQYADGWILADPKSPAPHLLRAELAAEAGDWDRVLEELKGKRFEADDVAKAQGLEKKAKQEKGAAQTVREVRPTHVLGRRSALAAIEPPREVIVYGTSWCGWCRKTRDWLRERDIAFVDKDVERDRDAAEELAKKAAEQHVSSRGVPIIDARGTLVHGFDPRALSEALRL
jgi:glutaredoxin